MTIVVFLMLAGLLLIMLFFLLPIRICGAGRYEDGSAGFWAWVRPWGGLVGGRISYEDGQLRAGLMVLAWVLFSFAVKRSKADEPEAEGQAEAELEGAGGAEGDGSDLRPEAEESAEIQAKEEQDPEADESAEAQTEEGDGPKEEPSVALRDRVADGMELARRVRLYIRRMRVPVLHFLGRLLRVVRFRRIACRLVFGAPDPATTGKVYGYFLALQNVLGERADLHLEPDFVRTRLEGRLRLEASVYLYRLIWAVACIAVRFAAAWLADVWTRWRRKRRTAVAPATS